MMMSTYVHFIDLKRWFIECHIFMPKKAFDYGKTEIYKIIHVDPDIDLVRVRRTSTFFREFRIKVKKRSSGKTLGGKGGHKCGASEIIPKSCRLS